MIAFLVFADWANPSMTTIEKTDGTKMQVAVLLETTEMFRVQLEQPVGELKKGVKLIIPKNEIVSKRPRDPRRLRVGGLDLCKPVVFLVQLSCRDIVHGVGLVRS